jgi:DNA-binding transcriptional LysR family regulator
MQNRRNALTPEALAMLQSIADRGSFAAAARDLGLVPSALTYRVRSLEDALDVLLFDRSSRQARPTPAGRELLRAGQLLLSELDAVANRVKRVATGWEPQLTIAVDSLLSRQVMMDLCQSFYAIEKPDGPPTRLKLRDETLSGTLEALTSGQADLALGVGIEQGTTSDVHSLPLGSVSFVYAVAPQHPLAKATEPLSDDTIARYRAIAVADSGLRGATMTVGLLGGQDVLTVDSMHAKVQAQLRGLGGGFLSESIARVHLESGDLIAKKVARPVRLIACRYAWRVGPAAQQGRALQWWLAQLQQPATRQSLLTQHRGV